MFPSAADAPAVQVHAAEFNHVLHWPSPIAGLLTADSTASVHNATLLGQIFSVDLCIQEEGVCSLIKQSDLAGNLSILTL